MRRVFLLVGLLLLISGCTTSTDEIPLIIYNEADPYIYEFQNRIIEEAGNTHKVVAYDSQNSQLLQNEIIEDMIAKNPRLLIINPVDRLGAYTIIDKVKEANIPTIFINREPLEEDLNTWDQVYYIGAPAENSALIQSEMVVDLFGDPENLSILDKNDDNKIQLVLLKGEQGHQDAETRTTVILEQLEDLGYQVEILSLQVCNWKTEEAYEFMTSFISETTQTIELVISNNDAMAIGAITAMEEAGLFVDENNDGFIDSEIEPWVPVIGIDGIQDAVDLIESGHLYGTVLNDSEEMAKAIMELTTAIINGDDLSTISFQLIDNTYIWVDYQKYVNEEN